MAYQSVDIGSVADDGTGDNLRVAIDKINDNFQEIYTLIGDESSLTSGISATATVVTLTAPTISGVVGGTQTSATITTLTGTTFSAGTLTLAAGSITDSSGAISFGNENLTTTGSVTAASLDISGDVDIDGTLETDALTIAGITLAETISDTVGAMVSSNTETNITVTYEDSNNTLDFVIGTLNQDTTGSAATLTTARTIGGVSFDGSANINLPGVNTDGNQNTSGTAATVTGAAQTNITSLGTLTALTVDDINLNGKVITITGDTSDTFTITAGAAGATTLATTDAAGTSGTLTLDADGIIQLDAGDASGQIRLLGGGTQYGSIFHSGSGANLNIKSIVSDGDIQFVGNDGGSDVTALRLDMSDAGTAYFNNDVVIADELNFTSDGARLYFGVNNDVQLLHAHDTGLTLTNTISDTDNRPIVLQLKSEEDAIVADDVIASIEMAAGDSDGTDGATVAAGIHAIAEDTFSASANATKLVFTTGVSETAASSATAKMTLSSAGLLTIADDFMIKDGGTIGVASANDAMTISSAGIVTFKDDIVIKDDGTIGTATTPGLIQLLGNNVRLTNTATADTDAVLQLYSEVGDNGSAPDLSFWRNSASPADNDFISKILFYGENDASEQTPYASIMTQIMDVSNGTEDGQIKFTTLAAGANSEYLLGSDGSGATFRIPNGSHIGSAGDRDSIAIASDGVVTMNQIPVFSAGINVSGGSIAGTLATAAQTNITSLGTLTALTVDDVVINGKVLTITGDTDDTFTITTGAHGATTIATVDTAAAAGMLTLDADGRINLDAGDSDGQIRFLGSGTRYGTIFKSGNNLLFRSDISDGDILIQGNDGGSYITAVTFDMSAAGKATFNDSISTPALLFLSTDGEKIAFGADTEITIRHVHNSGLQLRNSLTGDNGGFVLTLQTGEQDIAANDVIGAINFQAYQESTGTDAILVAAGIEAVSEGDFSSSNNATKLSFKTGASEAAAEKMSLSSAGLLTIADDFMIKDGGTIGVASTNDAMTISSAGIVTFKDDIIIKDAGTIGSASAPSTITISDAGRVTFSAEIRLANYIAIDGDNKSIFFGANDEIRLTHVHDVGLTVTNAIADTDNKPVVFQLKSEEDAIVADDVIASIEFAAGDSDGTDGATVAAGIHAIAEDTFSASANETRLSFTTGVSETAAASATAKMTLSSAGNLGIGTTAPSHALHIQSAGDAVILLEADTDNSNENDNPRVIFSQDGGAAVGRIGYADGLNVMELFNEYGDALLLGTNDIERVRIKNAGNVEIHNDLLMDHDGAIISFGANDEINFTHVHDTGITTNGEFTSTVIRARKPIKTEFNASGAVTASLTAAESGATILIHGTENNVINLPAAATTNPGLYYDFIVMTAVGGSTSTIVNIAGSGGNFVGALSLAGGTAANAVFDNAGDAFTFVSSTVVGSRARITCLTDDGTDGVWQVESLASPIATID